MNANIKLLVVAAGSFTIVGIAAHDYFKVARQEKAARAKFDQDSFLYALATTSAQARMEKKLESGSYRPNVFDLANDFHEEVEFEMIALRYDQ